jgi:chemotaxis protein methyltransferase CheR
LSISADDFQAVQKFIFANSGISLVAGKEYLVEGRLKSLVQSEGFDDLHALAVELSGNPNNDLGKKVVEALTTNETSFFRDKHPFETLKTAIIPELLKSTQAGKQIQIWSAASSSGQEPYSLAMLIADSFAWANDWQIKITASDISEEMLEKCRAGLYTQFEILRGLPPQYIPQFFQRAESKWQVKSDIRERIDFRYLNLCGDWGNLPKMDIVFIRNVLIYFDSDTKKTILEKMLQVIKPGGYLFLGSGEIPVGLEDRFQPTDFSTSACFKHVPS